jgi:hypothetical protein
MSDTPKYKAGDHVYLKESAASGFLESVRINGVYNNNYGWAYTISAGSREPAGARLYGDRVSLINNALLFFTEDELVNICDALQLAEASLQNALNKIQAQKASLCSGNHS